MSKERERGRGARAERTERTERTGRGSQQEQQWGRDRQQRRHEPERSHGSQLHDADQLADQQSEVEVIAGKHSVLEALKAGRSINKIWIAEGANKQAVQPVFAEAKARGIVIQVVDKRKLDQIADGVQHQGVAAHVAPYQYVEVDDLLARAREKGEEPFLLILDEVEDPHNLGSILRTADCAGVHGVIIPKRRSASLTATVSKTSAGAVEYVPVARVTNLSQTIELLQKQGIWIAGADVGAKQSIYTTNLTIPLAIVIGNEGKGLGRLVKQNCDFLLQLPMFGHINSLNASVAASLLMYEVVRQRLQAVGRG